jgi:hypothetical protein
MAPGRAIPNTHLPFSAGQQKPPLPPPGEIENNECQASKSERSTLSSGISNSMRTPGCTLDQMPQGLQVWSSPSYALPPIPPPKGKVGVGRGQPQAHLVCHPSVGMTMVYLRAPTIRSQNPHLPQAFPGRYVLNSPQNHNTCRSPYDNREENR